MIAIQYSSPLPIDGSFSLQALIGLFRNLALNQDNHIVLRTQGCIPKLWQLLNRAYQESQRRGQPGVPPGFVVSGAAWLQVTYLLLFSLCLLSQDGVSMDEVVECSTGALHLLARDAYNRLIMRQLNVIPMFVQVIWALECHHFWSDPASSFNSSSTLAMRQSSVHLWGH